MRQVLTIATVVALGASLPAAAATVGVREIAVPAPERDAPLHVSLWYPTAADGVETPVGDNAVFRGSSALADAPIADGRFPLVLISHGGFRAAPGVANWLASALAADGFVVAAIGLPPLPKGPATAAALSNFWLRPADLSATIMALEAVPEFAERIDLKQVGAVGFFLGGTAVMNLAGARFDPAGFAGLCDTAPESGYCPWFAAGGVDLHAVDPALIGRSSRDPRLKAAVAVDPKLTGTLTPQSLASVTIPVTIVAVESHRATAAEPDPPTWRRPSPARAISRSRGPGRTAPSRSASRPARRSWQARTRPPCATTAATGRGPIFMPSWWQRSRRRCEARSCRRKTCTRPWRQPFAPQYLFCMD